MKLYITTAYVNTPGERLYREQSKFLRSCLDFGYFPVPYLNPVLPELRPKFGDLLTYARGLCAINKSDWIIWCNSDCSIIQDIAPVLKEEKCYGFYRMEIPSGKFCRGIDMFAIPTTIWDDFYSKDIPDMFVGATHIDWWLARGAQRINKLGEAFGYLSHISHAKSASAASEGEDPISQHNIKNFVEWAKRNQADYTSGWS